MNEANFALLEFGDNLIHPFGEKEQLGVSSDDPFDLLVLELFHFPVFDDEDRE